MAQELKPLIVCDPTENEQPAITRSATMIERGLGDAFAKVTLLLAVDYSRTNAKADNELMYRDADSIRQMAQPLRDQGVKVDVRISWSNQWADSVLFNANAVGASSIVVSAPSEKSTSWFSDEFWQLIRNSDVPVAFIQGNRPPPKNNIVVALDLGDKELEGLNRRVMENGRRLSKVLNVPLHLASAYATSEQYPDRGRIVNLTGLPNENVHLRTGNLDEALAEITAELDTDLLVIGAARRSGLRTAMRGRKLSGVLHRLNYDVLVVV